MKTLLLTLGLSGLLCFKQAQATPACQALPSGGLKKTSPNPFTLSSKNYVVVSVFDEINDAIQYTDYLHEKLGIWSKVGWDPNTQKVYVYTIATDLATEAEEEKKKLKNHYGLHKTYIVAYTKPETQESVSEDLTASANSELTAESTTVSEPLNETDDSAANNEVSGLSNTVEEKDHEEATVRPKENKVNENELNLYFDAFNAQNLESVNAKIELVDPNANKLVKMVDAHQSYTLEKKRLTGDSVLLICDAFGYRKTQQLIAFSKLKKLNDSNYLVKQGDSTIVNFELQRPMPGDVMVMYNVYFHPDASVMKPTSRYELDKLLRMMNENEQYRIKIHGHTNGNGMGKIITPGEDSDDLFRLNNTNKNGFGSSKKLSSERAAIIKKYLIQNGIAEDRMEVKGWGGKRMLYDSKGRDAKKNLRVEIEVLANE